MTDKIEGNESSLGRISDGTRSGPLPPIDPMAYGENSVELPDPVREIFPVRFDKTASRGDTMYDFRPRPIEAKEADRPEEANPKGVSVQEPADLWTPEMTAETLFEVEPSEQTVVVDKDAGKLKQ